MTKQRTLSGFTLIELIVVMGIIAVLAAIVIIAVNPARQLAQARNTTRASDVINIQKAINQYRVANSGSNPAGLTSYPQGICIGPSGCAAGTVDLATSLVPTYLTAIPKDPAIGTNSDTGYTALVTDEGRIVVAASNAELSKSVSSDESTFSPLQIPNLSLWLKADSLTGLANAAPLGSTNLWTDSSGSGSTTSQAVVANQPTYRTNIINSKPVVRFDSTDILTATNDTPIGERTYAFVVKAGTTTSNAVLNHGSGAIGAVWLNYSSNRPMVFLSNSGGNDYRQWNVTTVPADNAAHFYEVYIKGSATADIASSEFYIDGQLQTIYATAQTAAPTVWSNLNIGAGLTGDMGEFMVFKRKLTEQQRANLLNYSQTKWATP